MPSARDIANYFLYLASKSKGELAQISNLKLQKLLYYAQGYHLAMYGTTLFPEKIEAWDHGPVVRNVYHEYKAFEKASIPPDETFDPHALGEDVIIFGEDVFRDRAIFTAWNLRELSHEEAPWRDSFIRGANAEMKPDKLVDYFKGRFCRELADLAGEGDSTLAAILSEHPDLPVTIHLARRELNERFGPDAQMTLRGRVDPEDGDRYATLYVQTSLPSHEATALRDSFDHEWWQDRARAGSLVINFELV